MIAPPVRKMISRYMVAHLIYFRHKGKEDLKAQEQVDVVTVIQTIILWLALDAA